MKTFKIYWAEDMNSFLKVAFVNAKTRPSAIKSLKKELGNDIIIDYITVDEWSYTKELAFNNID